MLNKLKELRERNEEGFTLIELLVVIVIIGILAAIALPIFLNQQKAAIAAGVKSDVKNVQTQIATQLVKTPTAADLTGFSVLSAATAATKLSDPATRITVTDGWSDYTIRAINPNVSASYSYTYDSTTGKYTETQ